MSSQAFDYASRRDEQQRELSAAILAAATARLAAHGQGGLSMRAIASEVGASTKVIYSHFGGKPGIVAALYGDGFGRLAEALADAALGTDPAMTRLRKVARAYRDFAIANPHLYELMYGPRVRELLPTRDDRDAARPSQKIVEGVFAHGQDQGVFRILDPGDQARTLWAAMHGAVALELTTWFDPEEGSDRFDRLVEIVLNAEST